jgi:hypothetical protein
VRRFADDAQVTGHSFQKSRDRVVGFPTSAAPSIFFKVSMDLVMTDQDLIFCALRKVGLIVAEHIESGSSDADEVVTQLIAVLDTEELAAAMNRVERRSGLRVVKDIKGG